MEEKIVIVLNEMSEYLSITQMKKLQEVIIKTFADNEASKVEISNEEFLKMFLDAKRIEGCSERTIIYYQATVKHLLSQITTEVRKITTEEIREYLSKYQKWNNCSNVTIDNVRRNISSFFSWLEEEDYILKSPMKRIHKIKTKTVVKSVISDEGIEKLRDNCNEKRDLAIIDLLYSTGIRVGELVNLNIDDIDLEGRECIVYGKGDKERRVYFDAKAKVHLKEYIDNRTDNNNALFVTLDAPHDRLKISGVEIRLRNLGKKLALERIHPHKFRRSMATRAIDKGMPIEQVQKLLGHDELSEEDRKAYEKTFEDEHGELPEAIGSSALNTWIFNEDTIKHVLNILMRDGIKIDYGQKLGKTIIFAKNHAHAEKILEIFNKEYPHLTNYANVIDNYMTYAQSAIDEFSDPKKLPQIAISVDMLDTGIDVPDVLNLVFFKKVMSKAKFWQMIGRGTRLFQGLLDGEDKEKFYIFDFCGNFEFFRMNKGKATANMMALQGAIFNLKFEISYKLQDIEYQIDRLVAYRKALVMQMSEKVRELPRDNFAVRQHLKYVDLYSSEENYNALTYEDTLIVKEEVAPLILSDGDEASAVRFDALMYGIELAYLAGKKYSRARSDLHKKIAGIASVANIPEIQAQTDLINKVLNTDYVDTAGINEFEEIREKLRNLMKYLPNSSIRYDTNFTDEVLSTEWNESELENDDLKNYKAKAEYYIRQHQDNIAIAKLKRNKPLTSTDIAMLEEVLWSEVGTKQDYEQEFGEKPLGEFVREIVGLDMNAAKEAFSEYLTNASLDSRQIYFVNQIVEYIVHNGMMKDLSVLQESPFTDRGSVVEIFTDLSVWMGIRKVIDMINANAVA